MQYYIYALSDPRTPDVVMYVGKTSDYKQRTKTHQTGKDASTGEWVRMLRSQHMLPASRIIEETDETEVFKREPYWIKHYKALNPALLNVAHAPPTKDNTLNPDESLFEVEKRHILHMLTKYGGNKLATAAALGIGRQTLYKKIEQYESDTYSV